jgi:RNA polymerase sigma-70 factor, ECF subfamily
MDARPIPRNFFASIASNPMSSLSGAHYEAGLPAKRETAPSPQAETDLWRLAQGGDRAAYGQIVLKYQDRLYNAVLRILGDAEEAREVTQEAFLRGLMKLDSFRGEAGPYTWLFRIATNLAISQLRKGKRHRVYSLDRPNGNGPLGETSDQASNLIDRVRPAADDGPARQVERRERDQQVMAALDRLDPEYRIVLVMRDIEGFDYQQMAQILDLPLGTLKSRLFRARLALRDELKGYLCELK